MSTKSVWKIADAWGLPFDCLVLRDRVLSGERPLSTRRQLLLRTLGTGAMIAGGSALAACARVSGAAEKEPPPSETSYLRIVRPPECDPGVWLARDYLHDEGFTHIEFIQTSFTSREWLTKDLADVALAHPEFMVVAINFGLPLTILAGLHTACLQLWVDDSITGFSGLRGRRISVRAADLSDQFFAFFATILAWIGIDTNQVHFVEARTYDGMDDAFKEGRDEAVLAGGIEGPRLVRDKARGHVLLDTMITKPWSQYECCHLVANRAWAVQNPAASKRVTRAIIKATDRAAQDHPRAAHDAFASGFAKD